MTNSIPLHEIIIPAIAWPIIIGYYIWLIQRGAFSNAFAHQMANGRLYPFSFFALTRVGWIKQNHLTGQASANTTRDYLRVLIFYASTAGLLAGIIAGYALTYYDAGSSYGILQTLKIACVALIFAIIFFMFIYSIRYGTHFHYMMNVKEINGVPMDLRIIEKVYHRSHFFYSSALRLYFVVIPVFAWCISSWLLLPVTPIYLVLISNYDDLGWLQDDIDLMFKRESDKLLPGEGGNDPDIDRV